MNEENRISVVINTYNAMQHLRHVIEAVSCFDEVLVCDMESTDDTVATALSLGCRVVTFARGEHTIVEPAREYAIHQASCPWVLVVDADELVSAQLHDYLYEQAARADAPAGIAIPRRNYFMGRFLHSAYPDYVLRFFRRDKTHWPNVIHASPVVDGRVDRIDARRHDLALEHLANDTVADIVRKANTYSGYEVVRRKDKHYGLWALLARPLFRFFKSYVLKRGFLDGVPGLVHAVLDAIYQAVIVLKVMERDKGGALSPDGA